MKYTHQLWETDGSNTGDGKLAERSQIDPKYQWRLTDIFKDDDEWTAAFKKVEHLLPGLKTFSGKLSESADSLLNALQLRDEIEELLHKVYLYAGLKSDQDTRISTYQAFRDRANSLAVQFSQAAAFIQPEILGIPEKMLRDFLAKKPALQSYQHYLDDILRGKTHTLPPEQEHLLAMTGELSQAPYTVFSMFNNADIKFPDITDEAGREVEVTKGRYNLLMESTDRRVRKDAFDAMYGTYKNWTNTLAATLSAAVKRNIFYARARKYNNALEAALDQNNIPGGVYENVVNTINENLFPLQRYTQLRKEMLNLDELHAWDLYVPLTSEIKMEINYPEALETIREGLKPLGDDYLSNLDKSFRNGWIDVYENPGKRSGAYSWATHGAHPYILLNYNKTLDNMFTIAHELGHALHSFYTHKHQPYHYSDYTIFVAEVASTLNEMLLMDYLLKKTTDSRTKLYLLNKYVDQIRGTVYNQALFAEFEKTIHEKQEAGEALTAELLNALMRELYTRYNGSAFVMDEKFEINWCRIPHFYYNFYVYQYATGMSAAIALSQRILSGDTDARDAYLRFLSRGNSDYSINLLKDAGVDMTSPEPIEAATRRMNKLLEQIDALKSER